MNKCSGCGQDFGSLSAFDHHQRWINGILTCQDPAAVGMHQDNHGRWRTERKSDVAVYSVKTDHRYIRELTDEELALAETEAVATNWQGVNEAWIQDIAEERNRREDVRHGLGTP